jgi:hypothetical protein
MVSTKLAVLMLLILTGCAQAQSGPGWYLMVPPLTSAGFANKAAPLSQWQNTGSFVDLRSCKASLQQGQFGAGANFGPITRASDQAQGYAVQIMNGKCVFATDSRLVSQ